MLVKRGEKNRIDPIKFLKPISNHILHTDYELYIKLRKDITSEYFTARSDAQKMSAEFSKLIIVNLQFINAGGLLAVPTLSTSLLGLTNLTREEKFFLLGPSMSLFAIGLISASLCAFFIYRNYQFIADYVLFEAYKYGIQIERAVPNMSAQDLAAIDDELIKREKYNFKMIRSAVRNYRLGLISGWLSVACFIMSCAWLCSVIK